MKTFYLIIVLFLIAFIGCQQSPKEITDDERNIIINEISQQWKIIIDGLEQQDIEIAFSGFSKSENTKYIRNGYIYPSIDTARNEYASWWSNPDMPKNKVTFDPVIYDIIDRNTVLLTALGSIVQVGNTDPNQKPWIIAYTVFWRKELDGWKIFNLHNSWE